MDRNSLSNYGWIIIAIIISSVILMFISPLGDTFLSVSNNVFSDTINKSNLEPVDKTASTFKLSIKYYYNSQNNTIYTSDKKVKNPDVEKYVYYDAVGQKSFYGFITNKAIDFSHNDAITDTSAQYLSIYTGKLTTSNLSDIKIKSPEYNFAYTKTKYYTLSNDEITQVKQGNDIDANVEYNCKQYQINYYLYDYETDSFVVYKTDSYTSGYGCPLLEPSVSDDNVFSGWFSDKIICKQQCSKLYES